jgi:hypothetical protein
VRCLYVKKEEDLLARIGEKIGFPMQKYKRKKIKNSVRVITPECLKAPIS